MPKMPPYLKFKTVELLNQWESGKLHFKLEEIILFAAKLHEDLTGLPAMVTSLFRENDRGVHGCWRGGDLRTWGLAEEFHGIWEGQINEKYVYKGKEGCKTALIHNVGRGKHLHLQVGPKEPKEVINV